METITIYRLVAEALINTRVNNSADFVRMLRGLELPLREPYEMAILDLAAMQWNLNSKAGDLMTLTVPIRGGHLTLSLTGGEKPLVVGAGRMI